MAKCVVCGEPGLAYVQVFDGRRKVRSSPVCVAHGLLIYGFEQVGQDWGRTNLARAFGIRKGTIPRVKISLSP